VLATDGAHLVARRLALAAAGLRARNTIMIDAS
jgi:hypothetical protein